MLIAIVGSCPPSNLTPIAENYFSFTKGPSNLVNICGSFVPGVDTVSDQQNKMADLRRKLRIQISGSKK